MIIEAADVPEYYAAHTRQLLARVACIAIKDDENRVVSKGTATLFAHESKRYIFTAAHVVMALEAANESNCVLLLPRQIQNGEQLIGEALAPMELNFPLSVLWIDTSLDVAVLDGEFIPEGQVGWFQLLEAVKMCKKLRPIWRRFNDENGSLPYAIGGYAEWGHVRIREVKLEILSALSLFAYITEWDDSGSLRAPQIHLEIAAGPGNANEISSSELHRLMASQMDEADSPFGGYSGGPLALFDGQMVYPIGIIKEGGFIYDQGRAFCSALDEIAHRAGLL